ncbi:hypothetical protein EG829_30220 [bacterium]|nr:hypothetical protein [bacterium]
MAIDTLHNCILRYFESEIDAVRRQLDAGGFDSFKEQVIAGRKIAEALEILAPYARHDQRARQLVRSGTVIIQRLYSVREVISKRRNSPHHRQLLLISQVMTAETYLQ